MKKITLEEHDEEYEKYGQEHDEEEQDDDR